MLVPWKKRFVPGTPPWGCVSTRRFNNSLKKCPRRQLQLVDDETSWISFYQPRKTRNASFTMLTMINCFILGYAATRFSLNQYLNSSTSTSIEIIGVNHSNLKRFNKITTNYFCYAQQYLKSLTELCECLRKWPKLNRRCASAESADCGPLIVRIGILKELSKSDLFRCGFSTFRIGSEWILRLFDFSSSFDISSSEWGLETFLLGAWRWRTNARTASYRWLSILQNSFEQVRKQ